MQSDWFIYNKALMDEYSSNLLILPSWAPPTRLIWTRSNFYPSTLSLEFPFVMNIVGDSVLLALFLSTSLVVMVEQKDSDPTETHLLLLPSL